MADGGGSKVPTYFVKKPTLARTWAGLGKAVGFRHRPARAHLPWHSRTASP